MKRRIITNNETRIVKRKPKTEEQIKKAVEKYAVKPQNPLKFFPGTPVSPSAAMDDFLKKKSDEHSAKIKQELYSKYVDNHHSLNPTPFLGGQAIATSDYRAWKPGNTPNAEEIKAMLQLLGSDDPSQNIPLELLADKETAKQLKAYFAETTKYLVNQHLPGLKVHIVPGTKPGAALVVDQVPASHWHKNGLPLYQNEWMYKS